jgi:hypothetical protein
MRHLKLIIVSLFLTVGLNGCTKFHFEFGGAHPSSLPLKSPPPGPPIYQQGWMDGCESGFSGYGNNFDKVFHTWKQDPELAQNSVYYRIWKDAYGYCANYGMMSQEHGWGNWR